MYSEEEIKRKLGEFKAEVNALKEKFDKAERDCDVSYDRYRDLSDKSCALSFRISNLGFFKMKEKQELCAEKEKIDMELRNAERIKNEAYGRRKQLEAQSEDLKERYFAFCREVGYPVPNNSSNQED